MNSIMNVVLFLTISLLCVTQYASCYTSSKCNAYNTTSNMCYTVTNTSSTTVNSAQVNFYGATVNKNFHWCPLQTTFCNNYVLPNTTYFNSTCLTLFADGVACVAPYQCAGGLCVNGKCNTVQSSINMPCSVNTDCEYTLACINQTCNKPLQKGMQCYRATSFGNLGLGMDNNECDYTQNLICGYTGNTYANYSCIKLFTVNTSTYVTNPLLCGTMITDSYDANGFSSGNCITNRATQLPILHYGTSGKYATCTYDSDCSYAYNGYTNYTFSGACLCNPFGATPASYCKFGGGEADIISDVAYYQKYWIPQYGMVNNGHAYKYALMLDLSARTQNFNILYCTFPQFFLNMTVEPPTTVSQLIFYIIVGALFLIGVAGVIVVMMMC